MASLKENIDFANIPQHIAVIMDGNGRWAKGKGAARIFGHRNAIQAVKDITEACGELGVKFLTLYAFSTENWGRPKEEIDGLMELLVNTLQKEITTLLKNKVKLLTIGNIDHLPKVCQRNLLESQETTKNNTGLTLLTAEELKLSKRPARLRKKSAIIKLLQKTLVKICSRAIWRLREFLIPN